MSPKETSRQRALKMAQGEAVYNWRQDKKICNECGGKQTYEEHFKKVKKCPCGGRYLRGGGDSLRREAAFQKRAKAGEDKRKANVEKIRQQMRQEERGEIDKRGRKLKRGNKPKARLRARPPVCARHGCLSAHGNTPVADPHAPVRVVLQVAWSDVKSGFLERMERDNQARNSRAEESIRKHGAYNV